MISFENHAFKGMDESLKRLFTLQISMAAEIEQLIALLPRGLEVADPQSFQQAKMIDKEINAAEVATDKLVAETINKYTPMGEELRFVLASVKTAGILERTADKIKNCIKRLAKVNHPLDATVRTQLERGVNAVRAMLPKALNQTIDYQDDIAQQVLAHGTEAQDSYKRVLLQLHHHQPAQVASDATHILLMAKNLEQAADMAIEIMKIGHYVNFGTKYEKHKNDV